MKRISFNSIVGRAGLALAVVAALAAVGPAAALARWGGAATLSAGSTNFLPTVASNSSGRVVAAWYEMADSGNEVVARISTNGGHSWGSRQVLGPATLSLGGAAPAL